jgi:hypothetical protein
MILYKNNANAKTSNTIYQIKNLNN